MSEARGARIKDSLAMRLKNAGGRRTRRNDRPRDRKGGKNIMRTFSAVSRAALALSFGVLSLCGSVHAQATERGSEAEGAAHARAAGQLLRRRTAHSRRPHGMGGARAGFRQGLRHGWQCDGRSDVRAVPKAGRLGKPCADRLPAWLLPDVEDVGDDAGWPDGLVRVFHPQRLPDLSRRAIRPRPVRLQPLGLQRSARG